MERAERYARELLSCFTERLSHADEEVKNDEDVVAALEAFETMVTDMFAAIEDIKERVSTV